MNKIRLPGGGVLQTEQPMKMIANDDGTTTIRPMTPEEQRVHVLKQREAAKRKAKRRSRKRSA